MLVELEECEFISVSLELSRGEMHRSGDKSEHTGVRSPSFGEISFFKVVYLLSYVCSNLTFRPADTEVSLPPARVPALIMSPLDYFNIALN